MQQPKISVSKPYFETLIALSIMLLMMGVFFDKILSISSLIERASFDRSLSIIRAELQLFAFQNILSGKGRALQAYEGTNPMALLNNVPSTYLQDSVDWAGEFPGGSWHFDGARGQLIYKVANKGRFYDGDKEAAQARYKLKFFYQDNDNNKIYNPEVDYVNGLSLVAQGDYRWR